MKRYTITMSAMWAEMCFLKVDCFYETVSKGKKLTGKLPFAKNSPHKKLPLQWNELESVTIKWDVKYNAVHGKLLPGSSDGKYSFANKWEAEYTDKGVALKSVWKQPRDLSGKSSGDFAVAYSPSLMDAKPSAKKATIEFFVNFIGGFEDDGFTIGYRGVSGNIGGSKKGFKFPLGAGLDFQVSGQPPKKEPPKKIPKIPRDLLDEFVLFGERNNHKLPPGGVGKLGKWADAIKKECEPLYDAIQNKLVKLTVYGHASSEGTKKANDKVSAKRVDSVTHALRRQAIFGSKVWVVPAPRGAQHALQKRGGETGDRRGVVIIDKTEAQNAIKKLLASTVKK